MDAVSEVLIARARPSDGLSSMLGASAVAHLVLVVAAALLPAAWFVSQPPPDESVMTISLGGAIGPRDGGLATLGGRPVQEVVESKKAIEPVRPPASKAPEMVEPTKATPRKAPTPKIDAKNPRSRTPTKGAELQKGTAIAETGGKGQGFGLSSGGGGTGGYLDVANFCCPDYLATMSDLINRNWSSRQGAVGVTQMKFVIQRDGRIVDVTLEKSSGSANLDFLASRALQLTRMPPLPSGYTEPALTVHLLFEYSR